MAKGSHVATIPSDAVELRGRFVLFGLVAAAAGAGALAYGWRATHGGSWPSWLIATALTITAAVHLWGWQDARTPRLVADAQGIRFRRGRTWTGTPWEQLGTVDVAPDRGPLRGGQLVIRSGHDEDATVAFDLPPRGAVDVQEALHALGAPLGAPLGTQVSTPTPVDVTEEAAPAPRTQRRAPLAPVPAAGARRAVRADVRRGVPESVGMLALRQPDPESLPEAKELRGTQGRVGLVLETGASASSPVLTGLPDTAVDAAPVDPYPTRPAASPVIGPELAGARQRFGLSVDSLADRTRIRPHVIESIEVDDFEPCGGDFYARGHIRSLARVLGVDSGPLLSAFDELYASAPVEARRVFEAELATGTQPMIRLSSGGPNWVGLLGLVVVLAIVWAVATMLTRETSEADSQAGRQPGPGAEASATTPDPDRFAQLGRAPQINRVRLRADGGDSVVTVRDSDRNLVWRGTLSAGEGRTVRDRGPLTVVARDGGVVTVSVNGRDRGLLGAVGAPARRVLGGAGGR